MTSTTQRPFRPDRSLGGAGDILDAVAGADQRSPEYLVSIVARLADRADPVAAAAPRAWQHFLDTAGSLLGGVCGTRSAVLANLVALLAQPGPEDWAALAVLGQRLGHQRLAALQNELLGPLDERPSLPCTTTVLWRMAVVAWCATEAEGLGADQVGPEVRRACEQASICLFLADVDGAAASRVSRIQTVEQLLEVVRSQSVAVWRRHVAVVVENPWSPYATQLRRLAEQAGPAIATAVAAATRLHRENVEHAERQQVAQQIRRLVSISGVNQRQFAELVGTSPSRLSTYINGSVTPSAAMLLRISRTAKAMERERLERGPSDSMAS